LDLKAVVFELAMLLPVTLSASELARRPERAVENEKGIGVSPIERNEKLKDEQRTRNDDAVLICSR